MGSSRAPVIGFVAVSGTGKTTLLKKLVPLLTERGMRIGYLKHAHHSFDLDTPGKDSFEIREAGASQTLIASAERWALQAENPVKGRDPSLEEMLATFDSSALDLVLVEGFKHSPYAKIEVHRTAMGKPFAYPDDPDVIAVVTDSALPGDDHPPELPLEDPEVIADFLYSYAVEGRADAGALGEELVSYYRWLRSYGCNDSHSGNASARDAKGFWITPTGACAEILSVRALVFCPFEGDCPQAASLDAKMHQLVYHRQPRARAILHSHGPYSVAMSFAGQDFRPSDFEAQYYFESVPVLNVPYEDYMEQAPGAVAEALSECPIAMVRGHGVYAWGETLEQAYKWTTSLELSAKTYVIARQAASL
jgi:molybdopterin-guanine dinucleotide biosynthesis protein MobB